MGSWLDEFIESIVSHEVHGIAAQQITYESVIDHTDDTLEDGILQSLREIVEETFEEENTLVSCSEHMTALLIDIMI